MAFKDRLKSYIISAKIYGYQRFVVSLMATRKALAYIKLLK